jgi:hypothetical protein
VVEFRGERCTANTRDSVDRQLTTVRVGCRARANLVRTRGLPACTSGEPNDQVAGHGNQHGSTRRTDTKRNDTKRHDTTRLDTTRHEGTKPQRQDTPTERAGTIVSSPGKEEIRVRAPMKEHNKGNERRREESRERTIKGESLNCLVVVVVVEMGFGTRERTTAARACTCPPLSHRSPCLVTPPARQCPSGRSEGL